MAFNAGDIEGRLTLDRSPFQEGLDQAKVEAEEFAGREFKAQLDADNNPFTDALRFASDRGDEFGGQQYKAQLDADNNPFVDALRFAEARGDEFAAKRYTATLDTKDDTSGLSDMENKVDSATKDAAKKAQDNMAQGGGMGANLLVGAIVAAIPLVGGAVGSLVGVAVIGIGTFLEKSSQQVTQSFTQLKNDALTTGHDAASVLTGPLVSGINNLDAHLVGLGPTFRQAFSYAAPDIGILVNGIDGLVTNVMPGLNDELRQSQAQMQGFSSLLTNTGSGLSGFFTVISQGANQQGIVLRNWGSIIQGVLPMVGTLTNDITNLWSQNSGQIQSLFGNLDSTITHLASGAMPALNSEFGGLLSAANGVLKILGPLDGVIGTGIGLWSDYRVNVALANAVLPALGKGVASAADSMGGLAYSFGASAEGASKVSKTVSTIGTAMQTAGPYVAAGATAIQAGLNIIQDKADSAFGSITQLQNGLLAGGQDAVTAQQGLDRASSASNTLSNSVGGQVLSWASWVSPVSAVTNILGKQTIPTMNSVEQGLSSSQKAQIAYNQAVVQYGANSSQAVGAANTWANAQQKSQVATQNAANAMGILNTNSNTAGNGVINFAGSTGNLITSLTTLGSTTSNDTTKIQALTSIIEQITNPAGAAVTTLSNLGSAITGVADGLANTPGTLVETNGDLNLLSKAGSQTASAIENISGQMANYVSQAEAAGTPTQVIQGNMQNMYNTLEKELLPAFKGNTKAVDEYLAKLGVPAPTAMLNASKTQTAEVSAAFDLLKGKVDAVPNSKSVIVTSLTTQAQQQLTQLGFQVTKLPNGEIQVTANNQKAMDTLQQTISNTNGAIGTTHIYAEDKKAMDVVTNLQNTYNRMFGTSHIDAEGQRAYSALGNVIGTIDHAFGITHIGGDTSRATAAVGGFLNSVNNSSATIKINAVAGNIMSVANSILGGAHAQGGSVVGRPGYADGGSIGPTLVGEHGAELVWPSYQSYVTTSSQSGSYLDSMGSGSNGQLVLSQSTVDSLAQAFAQAVSSAIDGTNLNVDGSGVATLVNNRNYHNSRR